MTGLSQGLAQLSMFFYLSKILSAFLDPLFLTLVILAGAFLVRGRRVAAWGLVVGAVLFAGALGSDGVSHRMAASIEHQYPDHGIQALPQAQAIVVLGGSMHIPEGEHAASAILDPSDRLLVALRLYRAGKAALVVCSGGNSPLGAEQGKEPEAEAMAGLLAEWGVPGNAILTETRSIDTHENAAMTYALLESRGMRRILLVTSALHMPRAAAVFRKAGFDVIPAPADFRTGWGGNALDWIPSAGHMVSAEAALHEWVALWVYRWRGWA